MLWASIEEYIGPVALDMEHSLANSTSADWAWLELTHAWQLNDMPILYRYHF